MIEAVTPPWPPFLGGMLEMIMLKKLYREIFCRVDYAKLAAEWVEASGAKGFHCRRYEDPVNYPALTADPNFDVDPYGVYKRTMQYLKDEREGKLERIVLASLMTPRFRKLSSNDDGKGLAA